MSIKPVHHGAQSPRARLQPRRVSNAIVGAPLQIGVADLERGGTHTHPSEARELAHDGSLKSTGAGAVTETLQNTAAGVEQSWVLSAAPAGDGSLTIAMPVSGETFAADDAKGLHFVDPASGLGFVYGDATWIDASGRKQVIHPRFVNDSIVMEFPADLVASSTYPVTIDPIIGSETDLGVSTTGAPSTQSNPDVAYDSTDNMYLVVWEDQRGPLQSIYAARVSATSGLLDPGGLLLSSFYTNKAQLNPRVAWSGTRFMVVWEEIFSTSPLDHDIAGNTVDPTGTVGTKLSIDTTGSVSGRPSVVYMPATSNFLVAFEHGSGIGSRRVSAGFAVDTSTVVLSGSLTATQPAVANYLTDGDVAFLSGGVAYTRRVDMSTGAAKDAAPISRTSTSDTCGSVTSFSYNAWGNTSTGHSVLGTACLASSPGLSTRTFQFTNAYSYTPGASYQDYGGNDKLSIATSASGTNLAVATNGGTLQVTRLGEYPSDALVSGDFSGLVRGRAINDGSQFVVAYAKTGSVGVDIYLQTYGQTALGPMRTSSVLNGLVDRAHGSAPTYFSSAGPSDINHVTWQEGSLAIDGSTPGGAVVLPSVAVQTPSTASNGTGELLVWRDVNGYINCSYRSTLSGALSSCSSTIGQGYNPKAAWTGSQYVVVYETGTAEATNNIRISRVTSGGIPDATSRAVTAESGANPDVACSSTTCTIIYDHTVDSTLWGTWRARMRISDGVLLDPTAGAAVINWAYDAQISARTDGFLVVGYSDHSTDNVYGWRLDQSGVSTGGVLDLGTVGYWGLAGLPMPSVTTTSSNNYVVVYETYAGTACADAGGEAKLYAVTVPGLSGAPTAPVLVQPSVVPSRRHLRGVGSTVVVPYTKLVAGLCKPQTHVFYRSVTP